MKNEAAKNHMSEQFLLVSAGPTTLAISGTHVLSVGEHRGITALPLMPEVVSGLCAYEGRVLPVFNLCAAVGEGASSPQCLIEISTGESRILVAAHEAQHWINADEVTACDANTDDEGRLLFHKQAIIDQHGFAILEPAEITRFFSSFSIDSGESGYLSSAEDSHQKARERHQRFLYVEEAGVRFALDAGNVEQVERAGSIDPSPGSAPFQIGFCTLHNQPVAIYSLLGAITGQKAVPADNSQLVVMSVNGRCWAFAVDRVDAFHEVPESHIHAADEDNVLVQSLLRDEDNALLARIDIDTFVEDYARSTFALITREEQMTNDDDIHHFLSIQVGEASYLLDADLISRITAYSPASALGEEKADGFMGITSSEGEAALSVDMHKLLGKKCSRPNFYAICKMDDLNIALALDSADRLLSVPSGQIDTLHGHRRSRRVARLEKGSREVLDRDYISAFIARCNGKGAAS
jgi:chemotaxis signal transduction protein